MQTRKTSLLCMNHGTLTDWIFPVFANGKKQLLFLFP